MRPFFLVTLAACSPTTDKGLRSDTSLFSDPAGDTDATFPAGPNDTGAPPEDEADRLALPPAGTEVFVFIANPDRDTVTRVNVNSSAVDTTPVGNHPTHVRTTADLKTAVVFNESDDSVSLIDTTTLTQTVVAVREDLNRLELSPDGAFAVLWYDAFAPDDPDASNDDGLQSYNEASFIHIPSGTHTPMVVGYRPRQIAFTPDGRLAVLVSDDYLAKVDLSTDTPLLTLIELDPGNLSPPAAEELAVDPSGTWAYVRQFGANDVLVVDLNSGGVDSVPAGDNPTDLDISPDGTRAVLVARGSQELWILSAADPFAPAEVIALPPDLSAGQLLFAPTGDVAVVYTTATLVARYGIWNLTTDDIEADDLVKPVTTMSIAPNGETLLVFHTLDDLPDTDDEFTGAWALSMIALDNQVASPLRLPGEPVGYTHSTSGKHGFFVMDGETMLVQLNYDTLLTDEIALHSNPVFVGALPDLDLADGQEPRAWVSQEHELGRISFWDPDDQKIETITGFELNGEIED